MASYVDNDMFGFFITFLAFVIGMYINKKTKMALFNPLIIAIALIIAFLLIFNIDYSIYNKGGSMISYFLGPATVILAVPLYRQIEKLKESGIPVLVGIIVGCFVAIISVFYLNKLLNVTDPVGISMVPKSVTAAISREVSEQIGGIPALTVAVTVLTGITGNVFGVFVFKALKIKDSVAQGVALGTVSHAIGTARAIELGEVQGAMASLSISVAGLITVFIAPWLVNILP